MRIGLQLPQWGQAAGRSALLAIARAAEEAGFDSVWASDHVIYPLDGPVDYPYGPGGPPFAPEDGYLEVVTTLSVVAGATERIGLGTSVLVLPMRETLLAAKSLATLDVLSGGRLSIVVAAGWWQAEFEALGMSFADRGSRLDEQLEALHTLWTEGRDTRSGDRVRYPAVACEPRPLQPGGPPLWVAGHGAPVWRRIARLGVTGWHGIGYAADRIGAARDAIRRECERSGRDPGSVALSTATGMPSDPDRVLARLEELAALGLSQVVLIPRDEDADGILAAVDRFGGSVRPRLSPALLEQ